MVSGATGGVFGALNIDCCSSAESTEIFTGSGICSSGCRDCNAGVKRQVRPVTSPQLYIIFLVYVT